jgi:two-component sensor histidine kinase/two-component SAPR family response regulator
MAKDEKVNILLVDDQPAKILSYEVILKDLGENLIKVTSGREALEQLLKTEVAVILVDVSMPDLDAFELAGLIRQHPRFESTAIIFVSAVHFTDIDRLRGYSMGAVDYVPVPVIPEVLRAKVRVFVDLYRKSRQLRELNDELERRVAERTAELEAAIERQSILAREVDHRAKNALAIVQSIVRLTRGSNVSAYMKALEGRIAALSRAHGLLSNSRWEGASLGKLVEEELAPYRTNDPKRIIIRGPEILLHPVSAQTLALALHELATNAAKYGSLSDSAGQVQIEWEMNNGTLRLRWLETNGPPVTRPRKSGFGTRLIEASISGQLGGTTTFDWDSAGLNLRLTIPRGDGLDSHPYDSTTTSGLAVLAATAEAEAISAKRALLVEDEALIGLMMVDILAELGFSVLGPITNLAEAVAAAKQGEFDWAILDINLKGELVYPVADILLEKGVPLVFVTGYGAERVDKRYGNTPILQKPLQKQDLQRVFAKPAEPEMMALAHGGGKAF